MHVHVHVRTVRTTNIYIDRVAIDFIRKLTLLAIIISINIVSTDRFKVAIVLLL